MGLFKNEGKKISQEVLNINGQVSINRTFDHLKIDEVNYNSEQSKWKESDDDINHIHGN